MTLIKWMLVLALMAAAAATLATICIPAYRQYVIRVTRMDAKRELLVLAQRLGRCLARTNNRTPDSVLNTCVTLPQATPGGAYLITGDIAANTFLLTATPQARQVEDTECGAFTLNQLGTQGISGTGTKEGCWSGRRN